MNIRNVLTIWAIGGLINVIYLRIRLGKKKEAELVEKVNEDGVFTTSFVVAILYAVFFCLSFGVIAVGFNKVINKLK